jgi:hypothetical protein
MNTWKLAMAGVLLAAAPAAAQRTISPGMSEGQVRSILGDPATSRSTAGWTYLYYHNGCPNRCGSDDVVFLEDGKVVAAVFRTGVRRFTGIRADAALDQAGANEGSAEIRRTGGDDDDDGGSPAVVGGVRIRTGRSDPPAGSVIIRDEADAAPAAQPLRRAGSRAAAADTAVHTDPPVGGEGERQARERRVTPNVIQNQPASATSASERERLRRERATTATVIPPQDTARTGTP